MAQVVPAPQGLDLQDNPALRIPPPPSDSIGAAHTVAAGNSVLTFLVGLKNLLLRSHTAVVLSLVVMAVQATVALTRLHHAGAPLLFSLPFALSLWGSSVGVIFEQGDVAARYQDQVARNRVFNVPLVTSAFTLVYLALCVPTAPKEVLMPVYALVLAFTAVMAFLAYTLKVAPALLVLLIGQVVGNGALAYCSSAPGLPRELLVAHTLLTLLGWTDLQAGTIFHACNVAAGHYFLQALLIPNLGVSEVLTRFTAVEHLTNFVGAFALVALVVYFTQPLLWSKYRFVMNNFVWTQVYIRLLANEAIYPQPMREEIYSRAERVEFVRYGQTHPWASHFDFRAAESIPASQKLFRYVFIKVAFQLMRLLDHWFPQSRATVPLSHKPKVTGSYADYFPAELVAMTGPASQPRLTVAEMHKNGQLLSYFVSFAHAMTMLQLNKQGELELDFDHMNQYETKPDFKRYGGVATFRKLKPGQAHVLGFPLLVELVSVQANRISARIPVQDHGEIDSGTPFRVVEQMLLSSSLVACVIGKHCSGIHSYFNLTAVSLHNAFDTQEWLVGERSLRYPHPIRLAMMPHFYNHVIVEELTTPHLLETDCLFPQVFAFTNTGLKRYYDHTFSQFHLNQDADLESRLRLFGFDSDITQDPTRISPDLSFQLAWELKYHQVFMRYATAITEASYKGTTRAAKDAEVRKDQGIQLLKKELASATQVPQRYTFDSVASVARFFADTIFCLSIRHEIYGKNSAHYADDWVNVMGQVAVDGSLPSVEEYMAQLFVGLATTRAHYPQFMVRDEAHDWTYLLSPLQRSAPTICAGLATAFGDLQMEFQALEREFTQDLHAQSINFELNRPKPSDLCPGSAY